MATLEEYDKARTAPERATRVASVPFLRARILEQRPEEDPKEVDAVIWPVPHRTGNRQWSLGILTLGNELEGNPHLVTHLNGNGFTIKDEIEREVVALEVPIEVSDADPEKGRKLGRLLRDPSLVRIIPQPSATSRQEGTLLVVQAKDESYPTQVS